MLIHEYRILRQSSLSYLLLYHGINSRLNIKVLPINKNTR